MSARGMLNLVGTAVGGVIGWPGDDLPAAAPGDVRQLFADLGMRVGATAAELDDAVRRFQRRVGLTTDGVAGPRTVHLLIRYAKEARELRGIQQLAA
jgi:murein L,D-transpeptidase YcbB/YkuD